MIGTKIIFLHKFTLLKSLLTSVDSSWTVYWPQLPVFWLQIPPSSGPLHSLYSQAPPADEPTPHPV